MTKIIQRALVGKYAMDTRSGQVASKKHQHVRQFADSTSDFRQIDVNSLNVFYQETSDPDALCLPCNIDKLSIPREVYVSDLLAHDIKRTMIDKPFFDTLNNKSKTFVRLMTYIMENESLVKGTEESRTDAFVNHILEKLDFGEYPFMIQPQPLYRFSVHTKNISSKYDFAVIKDNHIMLVDEDKHIKNTGPASSWGEHQIAGELIAGAYCNYSAASRRYKGVLYAVRVIGLRFTFYKASITPEYLKSLGEGLPDEHVTIIRYPGSDNTKDFPYLDYLDAGDRIKIIDMLVRIREHMLTQ